MAEIKRSVLAVASALNQRMPNLAHLTTRLRRAWEAPRNAAGGTVNWRFNAVDARIRLKHLYPIHE